MSDPRLFFLSLAPRGVPDQEVPARWRNLEAGPERGLEVAPGVRVALLGTGIYSLPGGDEERGAMVAVWTEPREESAHE